MNEVRMGCIKREIRMFMNSLFGSFFYLVYAMDNSSESMSFTCIIYIYSSNMFGIKVGLDKKLTVR